MASNNCLITTLETMELPMKYVTTYLMHEMSKRNENEPQGEDVTMMLQHDKETWKRIFIVAHFFLLQIEEQDPWEFQYTKGWKLLRICNAIWNTFQKHMQIDDGFGNNKYIWFYINRHLTSRQWSGEVCKLHHRRDGEKHVSCSKPWQIILGRSGGKCDLYTKPMSDKGLVFHYIERNVEWEKPCIAHMHVFWCIVYTIVLDKKRGKLDAKGFEVCNDQMGYNKVANEEVT